MTAGDVISLNSTYRQDALTLLKIDADSRYPIVQCASCGFVFAGILPSEAFLRTVYDDVIDTRTAERESQSPAWVAHQLRIASSLLDRIGRQGDSARILDYGCGYGTIVAALRGPAIQSVGVEPASGPLEALRRAGLEAYASLEETEDSFDAVILSDVLEHLPEPLTTLQRCRDRLRDRGWICISVPDFSPRRLRHVLKDVATGRPFTRELNPWEHLSYFSPATLSRMLEEAGFDVDVAAAGLDFGFRPDTAGVQRIGNAVKSMFRLAKFTLRPEPLTTTVLAQKR